MTQTKVGDALGVSFQQMQKYERGANRMGSSRLYDLSGLLDVPIEYFFDNMLTAVAASKTAQGDGRAEEPPNYELDPRVKRETLQLVRTYYNISDARVRERLFAMVMTLGEAARKRAKA